MNSSPDRVSERHNSFLLGLKNSSPASFPQDSTKKSQVRNYLWLNKSVQCMQGVGPKTTALLKRVSIHTIGDLLYHFPRRYLDPAHLCPISEVKINQDAVVLGVVKRVSKQRTRRGMKLVQVSIYDGSGYMWGTWFNQDWLAGYFKEGMLVSFRGKAIYKYGKWQMQNPLYDIIQDGDHPDKDIFRTRKIVPVYPGTEKLPSWRISNLIRNALKSYSNIPDSLPTGLRVKLNLLPYPLVLREIHFPTNEKLKKQARKRLLFEELFLMQVGLVMRKSRLEKQAQGIKHQTEGELIEEFSGSLPFELTVDQKKVIDEIKADLSRPHPMNRLLQGEVGSGKTAVALASLVMAVQGDWQGAIMAPTEVLAEQHYRRVKELLGNLKLRVALLTGAQMGEKKKRLHDEISQGKIDIVIGTHALIQEEVSFSRLGLVVIDEQHRFGVHQRVILKKKGYLPDVLIMTATPIPRTLSLTLYGDLDISVIKKLPLDRKLAEHVETYVCDRRHREWAYNKIREEVGKGRQAFVICPLIEQSDKLEVKAVLEEADHLEKEIFPDLKVGLIHGRLKSSEKDAVMKKFREGDLDILISTTVVEVGIDVPNASVILVEDADRFGLSQLHQLRGRIGRGEHKSYCIFFADPTTEEGKARMEAIKRIRNGFKLAEADLEIRGEGQLFGTRQSGLPDLRLAKLTRDVEVLQKARKEAFLLVEKDPLLREPQNQLLLQEVKKKFAHNLDWLFQA